ncbi:MAG TPA: hypothetical protein V6C76_00210 [Drouetiella sp.]
MANDKHVNVDEVIGTSKIRLVVTDAASDDTASGDTASTASEHAASAAFEDAALAASEHAASAAFEDAAPVPFKDAAPVAFEDAAPAVFEDAVPAASADANFKHAAVDVFAPRSIDSDSATTDSRTQKTHNNNNPGEAQPVEIPDADKLLRELPVDEFFKVLERATPEQLQSIIHTFEKSARTTGGSKILSKVIEVPPEQRTIWSLLAWWEWRRPLYNLVLALVGLPSILILTFVIELPLLVTVMSGVAYLVMANICYTLGTPAELVARALYKEKAETYGPVLLTLGTIFSVILTVVLELFVVACMLVGKIAPNWW